MFHDTESGTALTSLWLLSSSNAPADTYYLLTSADHNIIQINKINSDGSVGDRVCAFSMQPHDRSPLDVFLASPPLFPSHIALVEGVLTPEIY
jgi:hypothetical protein